MGYGASQYVFDKRHNGLPEQALAIGLTSVEVRSDPKASIPPERIFRRATREMFLSGISCYRTFDQHKEEIADILNGGKKVSVLIMDPDSPDVAALSRRLNKAIDVDIRQVIQVVKNMNSPNLRLRLMSRPPPFSAVMVDGDIGGTWNGVGAGAAVRVQPLVVDNLQHRGFIFEFSQRADAPQSGFDFFSADLRKQWRDASTSDDRVAQMTASAR